MKKTKERIVEAAILLFNKHGYNNISMQRLANELQLSPGNLTYHYPKKEHLMLAVYDVFQREMTFVIPPSDRKRRTLHDINEQINSFYRLQQRFLFFYLDLLEIERSYPSIAKRHYLHIKNQINNLRAGIIYNVGLGWIRSEEDEKTYDHLAERLWFTAVFWPSQVRVRGLTDNLETLRENFWYQIKPFLTEEGSSRLLNTLSSSNIRTSSLPS